MCAWVEGQVYRSPYQSRGKGCNKGCLYQVSGCLHQSVGVCTSQKVFPLVSGCPHLVSGCLHQDSGCLHSGRVFASSQ